MLALLCALVFASDPAVTVRTPQERQVIQQTDRGTTYVPVEVVAATGIGRLVASARPTAGGAELANAVLAKQPGGSPESTSSFTGKLALPAGGWYRLAITVDGIAGPVEVAHVERFGVGEVFVVAGQSNSTNYGEEKMASMEDRVSAFDGERWTLAADPMPGVQDGSSGGSPWPLVGKQLATAWNVPVAFASCGFGGTSVLQWQAQAAPLEGRKQPLYAALVQRMKALGGVRAVLWHQGESDANAGMSTAEYTAKFIALRDALAKELGTSPVWVVANVSFVPDLAKTKMDAIRAAQQQLWKDKVALQGPNTDDLLGPMRHSQDKIHFSKAGLEAHAKRWSDQLVALFAKQ
ncbi:MAG: hypothetical protein NTY35_06100 [Planctomycetota bacterium]|nr:hypothetical protein [Planctomycetota bacterium]